MTGDVESRIVADETPLGYHREPRCIDSEACEQRVSERNRNDRLMNLEQVAAFGLFVRGLDSPYHSPESREAWIKLFCRDMGIDYAEVQRLRSVIRRSNLLGSEQRTEEPG